MRSPPKGDPANTPAELRESGINRALGLTVYCWSGWWNRGDHRRSRIMTVSVALSRRVRPFAAAALLALLAGALAGCKTTGSVDTTGSIYSSPAPRDNDALAARFRANPRDADNAMRYAA